MSATLKLKEITRLLHNTPSPAHADARSRLEEFVRVTEPYELRHVQRAVSMMLNAEVPEANPAFAIFPAMLVVVCRSLLDKELSAEASRRGAVLQITAREKPFHQEAPALRKMAVSEGLARALVMQDPKIAAVDPIEKAAADKAYLSKHDKLLRPVETPEQWRRRMGM